MSEAHLPEVARSQASCRILKNGLRLNRIVLIYSQILFFHFGLFFSYFGFIFVN